MKILQLCTKIPYPPKDGGAAGIYVFSNAFAKLGHNVDILAVNPPKHFVNEHEYSMISKNIHIHPIAINTNPHLVSALKNMFFSVASYHVQRFINKDFVNKLQDLILKTSPDIVQIEGIYLASYIPVIRKLTKAPIVLREHNVEHLLWNEIAIKETNVLKKLYLNIQVKRLKKFEIQQLSNVDAVTFVTKEDEQVMISLCKKIKTLVVPFGVTLYDERTFEKPNVQSIYFLGALDWIPNQEALLWFTKEVWPALLAKFPDMSFHIAGRNAPSNLVDVLNNVMGVVYHGEVNDANEFAKQYNITVVPLFTGSGVRVKIIEAMEQGKVVIASTKALIGIPAIEDEHVLIADDVAAYIAHIGALRASSEAVLATGSKARQFIHEYYDIQKIATRLIKYYNDIDN